MEYRYEPNRIYLVDDGEELGEVTFPQTGTNTFTINHTFVNGRLRGQGIAAELVQRAVEHIESNGGRVEATCSYALLWLQRNRNRDIGSEPLSCPIPPKH